MCVCVRVPVPVCVCVCVCVVCVVCLCLCVCLCVCLQVKWRGKMRKFLEEVGSSDEEEKVKEEKGKEVGKEEEVDEMMNIDSRIEELQKLEAAEARRCTMYNAVQ